MHPCRRLLSFGCRRWLSTFTSTSLSRTARPQVVCLRATFATSTTPKTATLASAFEYLQSNRPEEALKEFRDVLQAEPNNVQALVSLALFVQNSDPEEAASLFAKAMSLGADADPDLAGSYATFLHNNMDDTARAEEYYRKATSHKDCKEPIVFQYGILLNQLQRPEEAKAQFERALQMDPERARTHSAYAALLYQHFHSSDLAERYFKKALELDEYDYDVNLQYATFLQNCRKDMVQAEEFFAKCLALDVHDGTPVLARFLVTTLGRHKGPDRFEELVPEATDFPILAYCSFAQWAVDERSDFKTAERFYKKCVQIPLDQSNVDPPLYAQIVLRYAFFCIHHMRQVQTAHQLVRYASEVVPDLAPDIAAQFRELMDVGESSSQPAGPNGGKRPQP